MAETGTFQMVQPNWVAYMVGGRWVRDQVSKPPGATRIQKDYTLVPGTRYRMVHQLVLNGKPMALPNGEPALLYSPALDATAWGTPISNPGISAGSEVVNIQPNFGLDNPREEYWLEVQVP